MNRTPYPAQCWDDYFFPQPQRGNCPPILKVFYWEAAAIGVGGMVGGGTFAVLNLFSARLIGEAEDWVVLIKLLILGILIAVGFSGVDAAGLAPSVWSPPLQLVAGGMIIFLAYEGFELIANTAADVRDPARNQPRAYDSAVLFVIVLYVLVAAVAVGTLPVDKIVAAKDYALAEAARPFLGQTGFSLIAVAAMLSTASAINATAYGAARLSYMIGSPADADEPIGRS